MQAVYSVCLEGEISQDVRRFVHMVFAHMDVNKDGRISMDEFREVRPCVRSTAAAAARLLTRAPARTCRSCGAQVALMQPLIFKFLHVSAAETGACLRASRRARVARLTLSAARVRRDLVRTLEGGADGASADEVAEAELAVRPCVRTCGCVCAQR